MSISTYVDQGGEGGPVLCPAASEPPRSGRRRGACDGLQGDRGPRTAPAAELYRRPAGRGGVRLQPRPTARAGTAHGQPPPEGAHRGGAAGAGAPGHVDVLPARARARGGPATGIGAAVREASREAVRMTLGRRVTAEAIGTALLLAAVVGSGIMGERLAGGNVAIALLANTIATGAALVALILPFGPISGAHFNPAVTLADATQGGIAWRLVPLYIVAQVVGAFAGVAAAHVMFEAPLFFASRHVRSGPAQAFSEFVATFGLL